MSHRLTALLAVLLFWGCEDLPTSSEPAEPQTANRQTTQFAVEAAETPQTFTSITEFRQAIPDYQTVTFDAITNGILSAVEGGFPGVSYYSEATFGPVRVSSTAANSNKPGFTTVLDWLGVHEATYEFYAMGLHDGNALIPGLGAHGNDDGILLSFDDQSTVVTAVGAQFGSVSQPGPCCTQQWAEIIFWDGGSEPFDLNVIRGGAQASDAFFGYNSPDRPIRSIEFNNFGHNALLDNFTYGSALVDPVEALEALVADVEALGPDGDATLNRGQARSLLTMLNKALDLLEQEEEQEAIEKLNAFIGHVGGLVDDGVLTTEQGEELVSTARLIEELIENG